MLMLCWYFNNLEMTLFSLSIAFFFPLRIGENFHSHGGLYILNFKNSLYEFYIDGILKDSSLTISLETHLL